MIRTGATDELDLTKKVIAANLTDQELVRCADVSSVKPVSQQQQLALKKYFGWPDSEPRWYVPAALVPAQREFPVQANDDPHLRNTMDLLGYEVWSTDRRVGILSDIIMEPNSWHIKYLSVKVGDWVYREERFVPTLTVQSISWGMQRVTLTSRSPIRSHTLPFGQDTFMETSGRCKIHGTGMPTKSTHVSPISSLPLALLSTPPSHISLRKAAPILNHETVARSRFEDRSDLRLARGPDESRCDYGVLQPELP